MTQRDRLLISGLVFIVLTGVMWFMLVSPKRQEAAKLKHQIAATQSDLDSARQQSAAAAAARRNYGQDLKALGALAKALPDNDQTAALLYQLNQASGNAHIKLKSISPSVAGATTPGAAPPLVPLPAGVQEMKLDLAFEGSFADLQRFLSRLQHGTTVKGDDVKVSGRLISVKSVALSSDAVIKGGVSATVVAAAYLNQPVTATSGQPGTATTGATAATTGATPAPAPAPAAAPVQTASAGAGG